MVMFRLAILYNFQAEKLLQNDGDFLVRQSSSDTNQYVLSGRQNGVIKHLLLVDPEGVVSITLLIRLVYTNLF